VARSNRLFTKKKRLVHTVSAPAGQRFGPRPADSPSACGLAFVSALARQRILTFNRPQEAGSRLRTAISACTLASLKTRSISLAASLLRRPRFPKPNIASPRRAAALSERYLDHMRSAHPCHPRTRKDAKLPARGNHHGWKRSLGAGARTCLS